MILKDEIQSFRSRLEHELNEHERMLNQWENLDWHTRCINLEGLLHRMWAFYDKADELSSYIQNSFPPYPFDEIKDLRRWLKRACHRIDDFLTEDYHPDDSNSYRDAYCSFLTAICTPTQLPNWQDRETFLALKEKELLTMLQKSYSVILELLLSTYDAIGKDEQKIHLAYVNALARYEQLQWPKDQKSFETRIANKYPWDDGPTANQLRDFYATLSDELLQERCGTAYQQHHTDLRVLAQALAQLQPSEAELLSLFRRTHQLMHLQQRIAILEQREQAQCNPIEAAIKAVHDANLCEPADWAVIVRILEERGIRQKNAFTSHAQFINDTCGVSVTSADSLKRSIIYTKVRGTFPDWTIKPEEQTRQTPNKLTHFINIGNFFSDALNP